jgi:hypothetical protein
VDPGSAICPAVTEELEEAIDELLDRELARR